jgi:hypothetical protein
VLLNSILAANTFKNDFLYMKLIEFSQSAYITYKEEKSVEIFYRKWSIWVLKEYLFVDLPLNLSEEKSKERQQYCAKINLVQ